MNFDRSKALCVKIVLFLVFFGLISLVLEITFFNKDFFYIKGNRIETSGDDPLFDYSWIRHLAVFLILILSFFIQKKQVNGRNLKPYSALFLMLLNIIPGVSLLSKYLFLFLSFFLFLYIKSESNIRRYKSLLHNNMFIIVFFFVMFGLLYPLFLKEGYVYDPLSLYLKWPGYRLTRVPVLRTTTGAASDLFDAFLPQWNYTYSSIKKGTFPLWRYNKGLGVSHYGSYHPEKLISFIIKPSEALTLRVLLKLFLSMTGMFFLLRALNMKNLPCIIGGIAYALSGFIIGWLHGPPSSVSYHIPFLFLFLVKYLRSKKVKFLFYFALWSSLTLYSGFIAVAGYSFYAVGLFLVWFYLLERQRLLSKLKEILTISLYWVLGIVVVSISFIPFYYALFISRTIDISYRQLGKVYHLSPKYIVNIIFPFFHGWRISPEIRPYISSILALFFVIGLIWLILKCLRFEREVMENEKYYISFLLLLIPFIMAMFGLFPFYQISCKLPILNSSPLSRLQSITCFLFVVLGSKGLDLFFQSYRKILEFIKKRKALFLITTEILFLFSGLIAIFSLITDERTSLHTIYPVFILFSSVIFVFQLSFFFRKNSAFFLIILLILVSVETIFQNRRYVPVNKKVHFITEVNVPLINFVKRNLWKYEGVLVFDENYNINGTLGNYGIRELIVHEFYRPEHKSLIVDTFSQKSFQTPTAPALASEYTDFSSSFIQLLGVKYLIFRSEFNGDNLPPHYTLVYSQLDGKVYENNLYKRTKGIFFCRPKYYNIQDKLEVIKGIKSMDYSRYVHVESDKKMDLNYKNPMFYSVSLIEYTPNKVIYRYRADSDGVLTFPEAYDEDWSVFVNGKKSEVLKTNLIFRGVAIREGEGEIIFSYHVSKTFIILLFVGFLSFLILISSFLHSEKLGKKHK